MLTTIIPKLPMRNKANTRDFYVIQLGFADIGSADFEGYLLLKKDKWKVNLLIELNMKIY